MLPGKRRHSAQVTPGLAPRVSRPCVTLLLFWFVLPPQAMAQDSPQPVRITGEPCASCTLLARPIQSIGSAEDPALFSVRSLVNRDSRGRMIVAPVHEPGRFAVYHASGEFSHLGGRFGDGPGEFRGIDRIAVGPGDSVHVLAGSRWAIFASPADGPPGRTIRVNGFARATPVFLPGGGVVWHGSVDGRSEPFHILTASGSRVRSFGDIGPTGNIYDMTRRIAATADGERVWTSRVNAYRVEEWDPRTGATTRVLHRTPSWFQPWTTEPTDIPPSELTNPRVLDIAVDEQGLLWLMFMVPAAARQAAGGAARRTPTGVESELSFSWGPAERELSWDTRIEIVDPLNAVLLYSQTFVEGFVGFESAGVVYRRTERSDGVITIERWELRLTGQPRTRR